MHVLWEGACLVCVICGCLRIVVSNTYCVVMLPVSLDYSFVIAPSVFSNVYLSLPYPYFRDLLVNTLSSHLNPSMF